MEKLPIPDWNARDIPTMQLWDQSGLQDGLCPFNPHGVNQHDPDLVGWLNDSRRPLHAALRHQEPVVPNALQRLHIPVSYLYDTVAKVTGTHPYPHHRMITASQAAELPEYMEAVSEITPGRSELLAGDPYQYHALLGTIVMRDEAVLDADRITAADNVASALGMAATGNIIDVKLQYEPRRGMWHWFGAIWRYEDEYYGQFLQRAQVAKAAAQARQKLGLVMNEADEDPSAVYRLPGGLEPAAGAAMAVDLLDKKSMQKNGESIYDLIRSFSKRGRPSIARKELSEKVYSITEGRLTLEALESLLPDRRSLQEEPHAVIEKALRPAAAG